MKKFLQEFKNFALQGNVMSLAVGLIIGAAFQEIVSSLIENIITPIIGIFVRGDFNYLEVTVMGATLRYGAFITSVINFIVLALVVFLLVRFMNKLIAQAQREKAAEPQNICPFCMTSLPIGATRCSACTTFLNKEG